MKTLALWLALALVLVAVVLVFVLGSMLAVVLLFTAAAVDLIFRPIAGDARLAVARWRR